ncbi:MAG TPA: hypothetical protein VLG50_07805 [Candidatus Saccharimonadales bacterium]|nr:hypothetical protein [Candidatus Saccharimonadales bacterium]
MSLYCQGYISNTGVRCTNIIYKNQSFCGKHRRHYALTANKTVYRKIILKLCLLKQLLLDDIYTVALPLFVNLFNMTVKINKNPFEKVYYITFGYGPNKILVRPV